MYEAFEESSTSCLFCCNGGTADSLLVLFANDGFPTCIIVT
jgi:hypothetical protein